MPIRTKKWAGNRQLPALYNRLRRQLLFYTLNAGLGDFYIIIIIIIIITTTTHLYSTLKSEDTEALAAQED